MVLRHLSLRRTKRAHVLVALRKTISKIFAARTARRWSRCVADRQRQFARKKLLPPQAFYIARNERREITFKHLRDVVAAVQTKIAPQVIGSQTGMCEDGGEAARVVAADRCGDMGE